MQIAGAARASCRDCANGEMKGVVKETRVPLVFVVSSAPACAVFLRIPLLCAFVSGAPVKAEECAGSSREDVVRPLGETDASHRAAETRPMCARGWSGIQRITADKQYCK